MNRFSRLLALSLLTALAGCSGKSPEVAQTSEGAAAPEIQKLSERELEVLECLARGRLYKEIADHLGVKIDTVRKHLQSLYQKLHVHTRTEAVVKYLRK